MYWANAGDDDCDEGSLSQDALFAPFSSVSFGFSFGKEDAGAPGRSFQIEGVEMTLVVYDKHKNPVFKESIDEVINLWMAITLDKNMLIQLGGVPMGVELGDFTFPLTPRIEFPYEGRARLMPSSHPALYQVHQINFYGFKELENPNQCIDFDIHGIRNRTKTEIRVLFNPCFSDEGKHDCAIANAVGCKTYCLRLYTFSTFWDDIVESSRTIRFETKDGLGKIIHDEKYDPHEHHEPFKSEQPWYFGVDVAPGGFVENIEIDGRLIF